MIAGRLIRDATGASAVEFALVAPTFFMFLFLILDGGRIMFAKQSLNEVATSTARCAAIRSPGCETAANAQSWAVNRGLTRDNLKILNTDVNVTLGASCSAVGNMAKVTVSVALKKGAMNLLPQSVAPATLTSVACFPQAS